MDGRRQGNIRDLHEMGLVERQKGLKAFLRGHDTDAEATKSSPGDARGTGQPRGPPRAAQRGAGGSVLEVAASLCCAGDTSGPR